MGSRKRRSLSADTLYAALRNTHGDESEDLEGKKRNVESHQRLSCNPSQIERSLMMPTRTFSFTLDFNCFNDLVEATYRHICSRVPAYSHDVTIAMFSYYCGIALWYRLYAIRYAQGEDEQWEFPCLKLSFPEGLPLPKPICGLLDSIGDFVAPGGVQWKLKLPPLNHEGHFGKMTADSFYRYLACPAPAVLVAALTEELNVFTDVEKNFKWRLKEIDFEDCPEDMVFTDSVCGYRETLSASIFHVAVDDPIVKTISTALEEIQKNRSEYFSYWLCESLIRAVMNANDELLKDFPIIIKYKNESNAGSLVQMGFVKLFTSTGNYKNQVQACAPVMLPDSVTKFIPIYRLRVERSSSISAHYPYKFKSIGHVPATWRNNLNNNFNAHDARNGLNLNAFSTGNIDRRLLINNYVSSFFQEN